MPPYINDASGVARVVPVYPWLRQDITTSYDVHVTKGMNDVKVVKPIYIHLITLIPRNITSQLQCISASTASTSAIPINILLPKRCNITPSNVHERFQTLLTPVLTLFTDFVSAVVTSEIAQILSLYGGGFLALKWQS